MIFAFDVVLPSFLIATIATATSIGMNGIGDIMSGVIRSQEAPGTQGASWIDTAVTAMIDSFTLLEDMATRFSATVFGVFDCFFALE